jgi:hypothetical protein
VRERESERGREIRREKEKKGTKRAATRDRDYTVQREMNEKRSKKKSATETNTTTIPPPPRK